MIHGAAACSWGRLCTRPFCSALPQLSTVLLLTQGKEWREALRLAYSNARPDLVDTLVAPQAAQAAAAALEGERSRQLQAAGWHTGERAELPD